MAFLKKLKHEQREAFKPFPEAVLLQGFNEIFLFHESDELADFYVPFLENKPLLIELDLLEHISGKTFLQENQIKNKQILM